MTREELADIARRIEIARICYGDRFDEDGREPTHTLRDQDRSALYAEVLALSAKLEEQEETSQQLFKDLQAANAKLEAVQADFIACDHLKAELAGAVEELTALRVLVDKAEAAKAATA